MGKNDLRQTLEIGYWGEKILSLVCGHSVLWQSGMQQTDRERGMCV